jgi:hypothetical protein
LSEVLGKDKSVAVSVEEDFFADARSGECAAIAGLYFGMAFAFVHHIVFVYPGFAIDPKKFEHGKND